MTNHPYEKPQDLLDESVNVAVAEGLKRREIIAFTAKDLGKLGMTDEEQLETAIRNKAVIFTHDADFLRIAANKNHFGIVYVRQRKLPIGECIKKLKVIAETTRQKKFATKSSSYNNLILIFNPVIPFYILVLSVPIA
jgi:predicted nuclease of predicted toxin-antitoxin system